MKPKDIKLLKKNGWEVECMSPFEIRYKDGGAFATGLAAEIVLYDLKKENNEAKKTIKALKKLNAIELEPLYTEAMFEVNNEYNKLFNNQQKILKALKIIGNNTIFQDNE